MRTAIIIPHVPGNEYELTKCIESVIEYSKDYDYEIFIVKNDYISFSWAVNQALCQIAETNDAAENPFDGIFVFNDDMILTSKNYLRDMYYIMKNNNVDLVVSEDLIRNKGEETEMCAMGFALFKPEVFEKIGLFDERFKIGEWDDVDLSIRMREANLKWSSINYIPWQHFKGGSRAFSKASDEKKKEIYKNKQRLNDKYKGTSWEGIW